MMIKEIKSTSNEELIMTLVTMYSSYRIQKGYIKDAEKICNELKVRGVIDNDLELFDTWVKFYKVR